MEISLATRYRSRSIVLHLQGGFDIKSVITPFWYTTTGPLALFKQVYRVVAHLAGHQPFPGSRVPPAGHAQDGSAGGDAGALLDVVAHFSGIPHPSATMTIK